MQFTRKKNKTKRNIVLISVLLAILAALTVTAVLLARVEPEDSATPPKELFPIYDEESRYNSQPIAYPEIKESQITSIQVQNEKGTYVLGRPTASGNFEIGYYDSEGNFKIYYPEILVKEDGLTYDKLYAKVTGDGYDMIPLLTYLIAAIRAPYFDDRVHLPEDLDERNQLLAHYGLSPDSASDGAQAAEEKVKKTIRFFYTDAEKNECYHTVELGSETITGSGYYFRVDGRDYIYVARELNYFRFALYGVEAFVNPVLVSGGLENNSHALYAPYITPGFSQLANELYKDGTLPLSDKEMKKVTHVFGEINAYSPNYIFENVKGEITDSLVKDELGKYDFGVSDYKNNELYSYLISALSGSGVGGELGTKQSLLYEKFATEGESYVYKILEIEAVITRDGDNETAGFAVGDNRYVRVSYELYIDGEKSNVVQHQTTNAEGKTEVESIYVPYHGILDLDMLDKVGIDTSEIRALAVGDKPKDTELQIDYEVENEDGTPTALSYKTSSFYLQSILAIYEVTYDENGKPIEQKLNTSGKLTNNSLVIYRYYYVMGGEVQTPQIGVFSMVPNADEVTNMKKLRTAIKKMVDADKPKETLVFSEKLFRQPMSDFTTYEFESISSFWKSEHVIGFSFVNASYRDPFYGESFYEKSNETSMLYAINQTSCELVVKRLGGILETQKADGLEGFETLKIGITEQSLQDYGCYANTVIFKLPRDMFVSNETADNELDDYGYTRTLDFVMHVSDAKYDVETDSEYRIVASELYDIIVKIEADAFAYLDFDTVDFWARRSLMLVDVTNIEELKAQFMMSDLAGDYTFTLSHSNRYKDAITGEIYTELTKPENTSALTSFKWTDVRLTQKGDSNFETKLEKFLKDSGRWNSLSSSGHILLEEFYNGLHGKPLYTDNDSLGTSMFKELILLMFNTKYEGSSLTDEEQAAVLDPNGDGDTSDAHAPLMRLTMKLNDSNKNASTNIRYCYEFYRCDASRIMVRIYETDRNGNVNDGAYSSDLYLSSFAFKKIVFAFLGILNGETIDVEDAYPDYVGKQ